MALASSSSNEALGLRTQIIGEFYVVANSDCCPLTSLSGPTANGEFLSPFGSRLSILTLKASRDDAAVKAVLLAAPPGRSGRYDELLTASGPTWQLALEALHAASCVAACEHVKAKGYTLPAPVPSTGTGVQACLAGKQRDRSHSRHRHHHRARLGGDDEDHYDGERWSEWASDSGSSTPSEDNLSDDDTVSKHAGGALDGDHATAAGTTCPATRAYPSASGVTQRGRAPVSTNPVRGRNPGWHGISRSRSPSPARLRGYNSESDTGSDSGSETESDSGSDSNNDDDDVCDGRRGRIHPRRHGQPRHHNASTISTRPCANVYDPSRRHRTDPPPPPIRLFPPPPPPPTRRAPPQSMMATARPPIRLPPPPQNRSAPSGVVPTARPATNPHRPPPPPYQAHVRSSVAAGAILWRPGQHQHHQDQRQTKTPIPTQVPGHGVNTTSDGNIGRVSPPIMLPLPSRPASAIASASPRWVPFCPSMPHLQQQQKFDVLLTIKIINNTEQPTASPAATPSPAPGHQRVLETVPALTQRAIRDAATAYVRANPPSFLLGSSNSSGMPSRPATPDSTITSPAVQPPRTQTPVLQLRATVKAVWLGGGRDNDTSAMPYSLGPGAPEDLRQLLAATSPSATNGEAAAGLPRFEVEVEILGASPRV